MKVTDWLFGKGSNWDDEPREQQREEAERFIAGIAERDRSFKRILHDQIVQQTDEPQSNDDSLAAALKINALNCCPSVTNCRLRRVRSGPVSQIPSLLMASRARSFI